jgi:hypothetical protein
MRRSTGLSTCLAFLAACSQPPPDPDAVEDGTVVEDGKEDNFLSLTAEEYVFEGTARVTYPAGTSEREIKKLISYKHIAIAWFLNQYLVEKEATDQNAAYGGFNGMVKTGSYEDLQITRISPTATDFRFAQVVAGPDLMSTLPLTSGGVLEIEVGKPTNEEMARLETNDEWYRQAPWDGWNPANVAADKKETLRLTVREETTSTDAWWDYDRLFADGKLDIDVHFGWDYHSAYHLKHSRAFYNWLVGRGFKSPVSSYDNYKRTSGPLTKKLNADGKTVTVEVRIFWGKPGSDTDPDTDAGGKVLEEDMRASLKTKDVIVFSGHSGPFYGFALANWKKTEEGDLDDDDMLTVEMPADRYQVVVAEGCDTYMIGEAFKQNPNKMGQNVDVITTTASSDASTPAVVQDFLAKLIETDSNGKHRPRTLESLLEALDEDSWGTMYGIHGVDDNPKLHPYAREDKMCGRCSRNSDCGGVGNACITAGQAGKICSAACTDDSGCGAGYRCKSVYSASSNAIYAKMCVPQQNRCPQ